MNPLCSARVRARTLLALAASLTIASGVASAQTILQIRVLPSKPIAGEASTLAARFAPADGAPNCNVRVDFGDETPEQDVHINKAAEVPMLLKHVFAKSGDYIIAVRPVAVGDIPACNGGSQSTLIEVLAPAASR